LATPFSNGERPGGSDEYFWRFLLAYKAEGNLLVMLLLLVPDDHLVVEKASVL
jgi:hypothetical protein